MDRRHSGRRSGYEVVGFFVVLRATGVSQPSIARADVEYGPNLIQHEADRSSEQQENRNHSEHSDVHPFPQACSESPVFEVADRGWVNWSPQFHSSAPRDGSTALTTRIACRCQRRRSRLARADRGPPLLDTSGNLLLRRLALRTAVACALLPALRRPGPEWALPRSMAGRSSASTRAGSPLSARGERLRTL